MNIYFLNILRRVSYINIWAKYENMSFLFHNASMFKVLHMSNYRRFSKNSLLALLTPWTSMEIVIMGFGLV